MAGVSGHLSGTSETRFFVGKKGMPYRLEVGQRFHRVDYSAVVWRVISVYQDAQGVEHATLADEGRQLDSKTLSADVLLDRSRYRLI